jgi:hypothetical protein
VAESDLSAVGRVAARGAVQEPAGPVAALAPQATVEEEETSRSAVISTDVLALRRREYPWRLRTERGAAERHAKVLAAFKAKVEAYDAFP